MGCEVTALALYTVAVGGRRPWRNAALVNIGPYGFQEPMTMYAGGDRERAPAFTAEELEKLVDGVLPQYTLLYGPPDQQVSAHQKKDIWRAIAKDVQTLGVHHRQSTHCRKRWEDIRRWSKKTAEAQLGMASQRGRGARRTMTPLMFRILAVAYPELDGRLRASQQTQGVTQKIYKKPEQPDRNLANPWVWSEEQKKVFKDMKNALSENIALIYSDPCWGSVLSVDASPKGLGMVLSQKQESGEWAPMAYASLGLAPSEQRYSHIENEATDIQFLEYMFHVEYSLGAPHPADYFLKQAWPPRHEEGAPALETLEYVRLLTTPYTFAAITEATKADDGLQLAIAAAWSGEWKTVKANKRIWTEEAWLLLAFLYKVNHESAITQKGCFM
ncbi:hypothetical protein NDU88_003620 [Pleurodeles waltl]|uniref:Myb-like domain-containing protein n=1 Tax=Pleurodeles waltl TaxID=8319 RepID=A0AAV7MEA8_PLEWA|nr:hypothetical protein NDU88_003620 [Pleurodeles waltl]